MINIANITSRQNRILLSEMVRTDLKQRYQSSALGYVWSLLRPLLLFGTLYVVFTQFLKFGDDVPNFAVSLLLGIVMWSFFAEATQTSLTSIVERGDLIRKIQIPRYLIVVARVVAGLINLGISLAVVLIFMLLSDIDLTFSALLFPLIILEFVVLTTGLSFFLSALYVRFRDASYLWEVIIQALFYLTPILYPLSLIPSELARKFLMLNPLAQMVQDARAVLIYDGTTTVYDLFDTFWVVPYVLVAIVVVVSALYFKKESKTFAENV